MDKQISDEIVYKIMTKFNLKDDEKRDAEELTIEIDNITYGFRIIDDTGWQDDNKYDYRTMIFQLIEYGEKYTIKNEFDVYFEQCSSRTGSYYTDWYISYDEITRLKRVEKTIPIQVIPEHTVVEWIKFN